MPCTTQNGQIRQNTDTISDIWTIGSPGLQSLREAWLSAQVRLPNRGSAEWVELRETAAVFAAKRLRRGEQKQSSRNQQEAPRTCVFPKFTRFPSSAGPERDSTGVSELLRSMSQTGPPEAHGAGRHHPTAPQPRSPAAPQWGGASVHRERSSPGRPRLGRGTIRL